MVYIIIYITNLAIDNSVFERRACTVCSKVFNIADPVSAYNKINDRLGLIISNMRALQI